jgi:hypothetical protein
MKKREDKFIVLKRLIKQSYIINHIESMYFDTHLDAKNRVILWITDYAKDKS